MFKGTWMAGSAALALSSAAIHAQTAPAAEVPAPTAADNDDGLAEIVVTANRRTQNLQKVSIAASALTGDQIKALAVTNTLDVVQHVPGVQLVSSGAGAANFFSIRGATQNDFAEHEEAPVATYLDGVYVSHASATAALLFDAASVEILRGPQGTLFGRNATAGLVQFTSAKPTFSPDGYAEASYESYDRYRLEGAYGQGITKDVAFRLSAAYDGGGSYLRNRLTPGIDPNNRNTWAVRGQLLIKPTDRLDVTLSGRGSRTDVRSGFYTDLVSYADPDNHLLSRVLPSNLDVFGTCAGCDRFGYRVPDDYSFYTGASNVTGRNRASTAGGTATVRYRAPGVIVTSISDYSHYFKRYNEDTDASPNENYAFYTGVDADQFSEEIHLENDVKGRFRWLIGGFYLNIDGKYLAGTGSHFAETTPAGIEDSGSLANYALKTRSWAVFGQAEYDLVPKLTLVLGARYADERKRFDYVLNYTDGFEPGATVLQPLALVINDRATPGAGRLSKGEWSGRAALNYQVTPDILTYVTVNRGFKPGSFNAPGYAIPVETFKFGEERVLTVEGGAKTEFLNHKLRINGDVFYNDYKDYQAFNVIGINYFVTNNKARQWGAEFDAALTPVSGLTITSGLALLRSRIYGIVLPDGDVATRDTAQSPTLSYNGDVSYRWKPSFGGRLTIGTDFSYKTKFYFDILNSPSAAQDGFWLQNARLSYESPDERWGLQLYARNLFAEKYVVYAFPIGSQGFTQRSPGEARTVGIRLSYHVR